MGEKFLERILIICSDYLSETDANGICIKNVVNVLKERGIKAYIISESKKNGLLARNNKEVIYGIKKPWLKEKQTKYKSKIVLNLLRIIHGMYSVFLYPNVSPLRSRKVYNMAISLLNNQHIDDVLCVYRPYESLKCGIKIKKKINNKRVIGYHLDLLSDNNTHNKLIETYKRYRGKEAFKKEIQLFDSILLPNSVKNTIGHLKNSKIRYVDFPLSVKEKPIESNGYRFNSKYINIVYIGSIDGVNREIVSIARLIDLYNSTSKRKIMLSVWGNVQGATRQIIHRCKYIRYMGVIENRYTTYLLSQADFTLNLSNINTYNMIPSKIFELISVGKPIINIVENRNDKALNYFNEVDYCISIVNEGKNDNSSFIKFRDFINTYFNYRARYPKVFNESTPEYTASIICDEL